MDWYLMALKRSLDFSGRSSRKEYRSFFLIHFLIVLALALVDGMTGTFDFEAGSGLLSGIYLLLGLLPVLAVSVRRLHDTGRSGWWVIIALLPLVGLAFLYFALKEGDAGPNRFGADPKVAVEGDSWS